MSPRFPKEQAGTHAARYAESEPRFLELQYSRQVTKQQSSVNSKVDKIDGHTSGLAGSFGAMFWATTHAADAIAHEMKNAVHGSRFVGAARMAGPQTRSVNRLIIPASALAAVRGKTENNTPRPQAICPAPVR
jgi:hypothetical protein